MKTGDRVRVHWPEWKDAAGHIYEPGKNHGKEGTIVEVTDYKVGNQRLYSILFGDSPMPYPHWTGELRVIGVK